MKKKLTSMTHKISNFSGPTWNFRQPGKPRQGRGQGRRQGCGQAFHAGGDHHICLEYKG